MNITFRDYFKNLQINCFHFGLHCDGLFSQYQSFFNVSNYKIFLSSSYLVRNNLKLRGYSNFVNNLIILLFKHHSLSTTLITGSFLFILFTFFIKALTTPTLLPYQISKWSKGISTKIYSSFDF